MSRLRRRGVRHLIVLGATDDALPGKMGSGGILSESELDELQEAGIGLSDTSEEKVYRELNVLYSSLTLPDSSLILTYPETADGAEKRPASVVERICRLLHCSVQRADSADYRTAAAIPCFELAAAEGSRPRSVSAAAAAGYFLQQPLLREKLLAARRAAALPRGRLSDEAAKKLYGGHLTMSASRVDKYYSCRFAFFLQYGLKAKRRSAAGFDAPEAGTFMHYVLENVTRDLKEAGGFHGVTDEQCKTLTMRHVKTYVDTMLSGFQDKSGRFRYLFHRLTRDALSIVTEMVRELDASDFVPMDFELEFSPGGDLPPATLSGGGTDLALHGFVDRVDGWIHDGRLYLRVIDYKTGRKSFSLSDIYNGLGMQMLIYLFTLQKYGAARYGREIVPAGVLYAPAGRSFCLRRAASATRNSKNSGRKASGEAASS
jgi:ATP-dependent helicase/nuclease subunit B